MNIMRKGLGARCSFKKGKFAEMDRWRVNDLKNQNRVNEPVNRLNKRTGKWKIINFKLTKYCGECGFVAVCLFIYKHLIARNMNKKAI